jgi:hypothetical protein
MLCGSSAVVFHLGPAREKRQRESSTVQKRLKIRQKFDSAAFFGLIAAYSSGKLQKL